MAELNGTCEGMSFGKSTYEGLVASGQDPQNECGSAGGTWVPQGELPNTNADFTTASQITPEETQFIMDIERIKELQDNPEVLKDGNDRPYLSDNPLFGADKSRWVSLAKFEDGNHDRMLEDINKNPENFHEEARKAYEEVMKDPESFGVIAELNDKIFVDALGTHEFEQLPDIEQAKAPTPTIGVRG